jgi:hypothetical protein
MRSMSNSGNRAPKIGMVQVPRHCVTKSCSRCCSKDLRCRFRGFKTTCATKGSISTDSGRKDIGFHDRRDGISIKYKLTNTFSMRNRDRMVRYIDEQSMNFSSVSMIYNATVNNQTLMKSKTASRCNACITTFWRADLDFQWNLPAVARKNGCRNC